MLFMTMCESMLPRYRRQATALVLCVASFTACAVCQVTKARQAPGSQSTAHVAPIPLPLLYRCFLAYQNHLDRAAAAREKQGQDGAWLRDHFQRRLGFTDEQFASVRETGERLETELHALDVKAKAIIDATRAAFPNAKVSEPETLPPVPPELIELQEQREALIEREVATLKEQLGPAASAKLDSFLRKEFSQTVTVHTIQLPRPHNPASHPLPPFSQEVPR